jgi:hypothetical protein
MGNPYDVAIADLNVENRLTGKLTFTDPANQPGGSQPFKSETGTTDPNTFTVTETFDVNAAGVVVLTMTLTATSPDGETFGSGLGQIGVAFTPQSSPDGIAWIAALTLLTNSALDNNGTAITVGQFYAAIYATFQEGRGVADIVNSDGSPYVGANHPTATVRFDYGVLTLGSNLV